MSADNPLLEGFTDIKKAQAITPELKNPLLEGYDDVQAAPETKYGQAVQATSGISAEQMREGLNAQAEMNAPLDWIQNNQSQVTKFREAQAILHTLDNSNAPVLKKRAEDFKFLGVAKDDLHTLASLNTMSSFAATGIKGLSEVYAQKALDTVQTQDKANRSQLQEMMLRRAARDVFQGPAEGGVEMNSARSYNNLQRDFDALGGLPFMSPENLEEIYKKTYETLRSDDFAYARYLDDKSKEQEIENLIANAPDNAFLRNTLSAGIVSAGRLRGTVARLFGAKDYSDDVLEFTEGFSTATSIKNVREQSSVGSTVSDLYSNSLSTLLSVLTTPGGLPAIIARQGLEEGVSSNRSAREQGLSDTDALVYGIEKGVIEAGVTAAFSIGPLGRVLGPGTEGALGTGVIRGFKSALTREGLKAGAKNFAGEVIEEEFITTLGHFLDRATFGSGYTGDLVEAVKYTALQTAFTMGLAGGSRKTISAIGNATGKIMGRAVRLQAEANDSIVTENHFGEIEATVLESKLRERSPEDFESYIDETLENSPVKDIYLPADKLDEYFQTVNDPEAKQAMLDALDIQVDFQNAVDLGTDIKIASSKWLTSVSGTDAGEAMKAFMKFSPDVEAMSPADRAEFVKDRELILQTARDEALKEIQENGVPEFAQTYRDAILNDNKLGVDAEGADMEMAAFLAQVDSVRKQTGETREEFVARKNYVVEIDGVQVPLVPTDAQVSNQILQERNFALADTENAQTPSGVSYAETYRDPIEGSTWAELDDTRRQEIINADYARSLPAVEDADGLEYNQEGQLITDSENFKNWFGDSQVVDENGEPLVVYHGTPDARFLQEDGAFKSESERFGVGGGRSEGVHWFTPSVATATTYADDRRAFDYQNSEPDVISAYVNLSNPLIIEAGGARWRDAQKRGKTSDVIKEAQEKGHDGVIIRNVKDDYQTSASTRATDTYAVFEPTQIKSVDNTGAFDPQDSNIFNQSATSQQEDAEYMAAVESGDNETAQKYVDAAAARAGYDTKAFHGTRAKEGFRVFDNLEGDVQSHAPEGSTFFASTEDAAMSYTGDKDQVAPFFLNLGDPFYTDFDGADWQGFAIGKFGVYNSEEAVTEIFNTREKAEANLLELDPDADVTDDSLVVADPYLDVNTNQAAEEAKRGGADSAVLSDVIDYGGQPHPGADDPIDVYVVFDSSRAKSSDPVTYDEQGNVIPLSQRFDTTSEDIFFQSAAFHGSPVQDIYGEQIQVGGEWYHAEKIFGKPASEFTLGEETSIQAEGQILDTGERLVSIDSGLFQESGSNISTEPEKIQSFKETMQARGGWGDFPPITGVEQTVTTDDVVNQEDLVFSRELTESDIGTKFVQIENGHNRAYAASELGIPLQYIDPSKGEQFAQDAQGQAGAKGSIVFPKRTGDATIVKLLQNRDVSTLGHELAHDYFQDMKSIIASGQGDEQFLADYQTIRQWSSEQGSQLLKDIKKSGNTQALDFINANGGAKFISQVAKGEVEGGVATEAIDRSIHELFARGSEVFRREGKAPSTKLAAAFRRFQEWLTTIYKTAAELGVEMSDEMRGAYGRMYASNEEINQATDYYEGKTDILDTLNADREEREAAKARRNAAEDDSKDKNWERFRKAWFKTLGGKKGIQAKATDEVKESRVYTAMYDAIEGVGLNLGEVTEAFGKQTADDMKTKNSKILKKNGAPISDFVIRYEYESAKEFIDDLHGAPKRNEMIKIRTEDLMREEEQKARQAQDALDAHEGSEAYHSDLRLEALAVEYEALQDRSAINRGQEPARSGARAIVRTEVLPEVKYPKGGIAEVHQQVIESGDRAVLTKHKERIDNELAKLDEEYDRPIVRSRKALKNSFTAAEQGYDVSEEGAIRLIRRALPNVFKKGEVQSKSRRESLGLYDSMLDTAHDVLVNNEFEQLADNAQDLLDRALEIPTQQAADENRNEAIKATVRDQYQGEIDLAQEELGFMFTEADQALASLPEEVSRVAPEFHSSETAKIFREAAQEAISELPVREATQYHLYANREARASRKSFRLAQKGDIEGAEVEKRLQLINHAMVTASVKAREERSKTEKSIKRLSKGKTVEAQYSKAMASLAYQYGLSSKEPTGGVKSVASLINDDGILPSGVAIPEWLASNTEARDYRDLTMAQFRELFDAFKVLNARGSNLTKSLEAAQGATIEEFVERAVEPMQERASKAKRKEGDVFLKQSEFMDGVAAELTMMQFAMKGADNYQSLGPEGTIGPNESMVVGLSDAASKRKKIWSDEIEPEMKRVTDGLKEISKRMESQKGKTFEIPGLPFTVDAEGVIRENWTFERVVSAILNTGNEGNLKALKEGFGFDDDQIRILQSQLTKQEYKVIQDVWKLIDSRFKATDKVFESLNGKGMTKVLAAPSTVRTLDGEYVEVGGGYYPIMPDHKLNETAAKNQEENLFMSRMMGVTRTPGANDQFVNERTGTSLPPMLSLDVMFQHLSDVVHYETHAELINDMDKITQNPNWKANFIDKEGHKTYKQIRPWLQSIARPGRPYLDDSSTWFEKQRRLSTAAILGWNLSVALKQPFSAFNALGEIGMRDFSNGAMDFAKDPVGIKAKVNKLSANMAQRGKSVDRELTESMKRANPVTSKGQKLSDVRDAGFALIGLMDSVTVYPIWMGAYNKELRKSGNQKKAVQYADNIIRTTQPSSDALDLAYWQRSNSPIHRILSMFKTYTLKYGNLTRTYHKAWKEGALSNKEYARHVALAQLAPPIVMSMFMSLIRNGELPEWEDVGLDTVGYWLSWIPLLDSFTSLVKYGSGPSESPAFEGLDRMGKLITTGKKVVEKGDKNAWKKAASALGDVVEFEAGIPALRVAKTLYKGIDELDETKNPVNLFIKPTKKKGAR